MNTKTEEQYVQHGRWFITKIGDSEYRARVEDYGFSYATMCIQEKAFLKVKTWLFFGPIVEIDYWKTIVKSSREEYPIGPVIPRRKFYEVSRVRKYLKDIIPVNLSHQKFI